MDVEKTIGMKNNKRNQRASRNKTIKWKTIIPLLVIGIALAIPYMYILINTVVVCDGEPREVVISNFMGDVEFDTRSISIDRGVMTNNQPIVFYIESEKYEAAPGELLIEFNDYLDYSLFGIPWHNSLITENYNMSFSTSSMPGDYKFSTNQLTIKNGDNTLEYSHSKIIRGCGSEKTTKIIAVDLSDQVPDIVLTIQNNEIMNISGGCIISYKGDVIRKNHTLLHLQDNEHGCEFLISNISDMDIFLNETGGVVLNGKVDSLEGTLEYGEGRILTVSPSGQKAYEAGGQEVQLKGKKIQLEYSFNNAISRMLAKGKPGVAKIEKVDIRENIVLFLVSNYSAIILTLIGSAVTKILIEKNAVNN